jgi:AcrR family transcriptional regulator
MNRAATAQRAPRKRELSGDRLLEVSAILFRDHGYSLTTMRDIAQAAGMKAGSLYYHFQSKDQILDKVLERGISEAIHSFKVSLAKLPPNAPFAEKLTAAVVAHLRTTAELGTYTVASRQLLNQIPDVIREKHLAMRDEYDRMWSALLDEGKVCGAIKPKANFALVRLFLLGAINWSTEWYDPKRKSPEELGAIAADFFLNGLSHD